MTEFFNSDAVWVRPVTNIKDAPAYRAMRVLIPKVGNTSARLAVSVLVYGRNSALSKWQMLQRDCGLTAMEAGDLMRSLGLEHAASICPECRRPIGRNDTCSVRVETNERLHEGCL